MNPVPQHDPLDDLIFGSLNGVLTPEEQAQLDARLKSDPAARAAFEEARKMHEMLEKTFTAAQPNADFEQRMVSGVRRKLNTEEQRTESPWESVLAIFRVFKILFRLRWTEYAVIVGFVGIVICSALISMGNQVKGVFTTISAQLAYAGSAGTPDALPNKNATWAENWRSNTPNSGGATNVTGQIRGGFPTSTATYIEPSTQTVPQGGTIRGQVFIPPSPSKSSKGLFGDALKQQNQLVASELAVGKPASQTVDADGTPVVHSISGGSMPPSSTDQLLAPRGELTASGDGRTLSTENIPDASGQAVSSAPEPVAGRPVLPATQAQPALTRKLVRDAQLELEVKNFEASIDQISTMTKAAGGYVDSSQSERGGNGKLQGTIVVKVLPQNLDSFLLKLRSLGTVRNQTVKTEDVTKDYYDTTARLENARKTEAQLQELLKRNNGKVSELLEVEREMNRVRGDIEQMEGSLKYYDFLVAYATVTIELKEKDLNETAAYVLKEKDEFSLYATNVEDTFQKARKLADDCKAQILVANLNHQSGSQVSAELIVMVDPDQIDTFLAQTRSLGRVDNFVRQSQREARDGGNADQPANETLTERDKVQVHLSIRSDDESRKQVALTVVAPKVDDALEQAKKAALDNAGTEILNSALNRTPEGKSQARLVVRVPGKAYNTLLEAFRALGRTVSFSLQREDNAGPGANGDDAPVIVTLLLTDTDTPVQVTRLTLTTPDVDTQAQTIKKAAVDQGVEITSSNFVQQPDGSESAQITLRLSLAKYPAFLEALKKTGKVQFLTTQRIDRPDQARSDAEATVEINLQLNSQETIVTNDDSLWTALKRTFGAGAGTLYGLFRLIGMLVAFLLPWALAAAVLAWTGRRIYLWRKNAKLKASEEKKQDKS